MKCKNEEQCGDTLFDISRMKQKVIILGSNPITRLSLIRSIGEAMDCEITVVDMVHSLSKKQRKTV